MIRVADYVVKKLKEIGISHVFMVTGRGILFLTDAVAKLEGMEGVSVHHEQSGAFAAYAYAQRRNACGACMVSTGVGATNAVTGVLNAWQDGVPVIFVSGQNMMGETVAHTGIPVRTFGQQEADIVGIVSSITKYATMIRRAEDIAYEMEKAIAMATTGRMGPVWLDIPLDIQNARVEPGELRHYEETLDVKIEASEKEIDYVARLIEESKRPIILFGSGVASAGAKEQLAAFIERARIPVVFDSAACDVYPDEHDLSIGTIGSMGGSRVGNFALQNADLVVVIGCRMTSMQVGDDPDKFARAAKVVMVDIDENEPKKGTARLDLFIHSDAKAFIGRLHKKIKKEATTGEWISKCEHWKKVFPKCEGWCRESQSVDLYFLSECIGTNVGIGETVTCDAGIEELVVPPVVCKKDGVRCIHPASQGCMGFALGASIGAYYAGNEQVVAVVGDGSLMMNIQELQTISYRRLPIKIFVCNNNCYAVIRKRQQDLFRSRTIGTDGSNGVSCADLKRVAYAFDLKYRKIDSSHDLALNVSSVLDEEGPVLCEVKSKEDQDYLRNAIARTEKGKVVRRYLEDQAPFLDRERICSEMIVDMLEE